MRPKPDFLPRMRGATGSVAGRRGLVPKPAAADNVKYLKGDGTWSALSNASAATDAEAAAGTSSTTFVTPANAALAAAKVINPRAPRQALVFDGTFPATGTLSAFGANGYSIAVQFNLPSLATDHGLFDGSGLLFIVVRSTGRIDIYDRVASAYLLQTAAGIITAGKTYNLQVVRGSAYLNGIALGTYADNSTYTGTSYKLGSDFISGTLAKGTIGLIGICNRTLSAAEVLALYEQGAPAAADYNTSTGSTITAGAFVVGKKCRIVSVGTTTFTGIGASANTVGVEFTATGVGTGTGTATALGLLCAPEATAPGAGLEWLDASGIRAHVVLPASGVAWAIPSQGAIVIEATTNTATNQQLGGASLIDTNKQWRIQSWTVNCATSTPTISLGNVSAGAQYVSAAVLAAGNNDITLLTRFPSTANLWCNSSTTATLIHRIVLVPAN